MLGNIGNFLNSLDSVVKDTLSEETPKLPLAKRKSPRTNNDGDEYSINTVSKEVSEESTNDVISDLNSTRSSQSMEHLSEYSNHSTSGVSRLIPADFNIAGTPDKSTFLSGTFPSSGNLSMSSSSRLPPTTPGTVPNGGSKSNLSANGLDVDSELRKTLKEKCLEIKQLQRELSEVEDEKRGLEQELRSAWDNYKQAQEKAIGVESDLQDELRGVLNAKNQEKQLVVSQITKLNEDVIAAVRQVAAAQSERDEMSQRLLAADQLNSGWAAQVQALSAELLDARASTVQGVHNLREELRLSQTAAEQMRHDHNSVVRQNQTRLAQLELENTETNRLLVLSQREIAALLKSSGGGSGSGEDSSSSSTSAESYLNRDYLVVQQEVIRLSAAMESEQELRLDAERRVKHLEFEARATLLNMEDERRRNADTARDMAAQTAVLEDKLRDLRRSADSGAAHRPGGLFSSSQTSVDAAADGSLQSESRGDEFYRRLESEAVEAKEQARNLSQLLLKKQGLVVDLQAERSALKARCLDLQARCSKAEQGLSALRDLEDGGGDDESHYLLDGGGDKAPHSAGGTLQRRGAGGGGEGVSGAKGGSALGAQSSRVISDLEKMGVKPGARVAKAVNLIDSWTLLTGRFLRSYPLFRLGFVLYLVVIHVWVFVILLLHMETLDLDSAESQQQQMLHPQ